MTLVFWIVNFVSLFSSVGTVIVLLIFALRFRKPGFFLLFLFLVSLSLNYALGMFQILENAGAPVMPPREYIKILFAKPTAAALVREVFVILISLSAPAGVLSLLGKPLGRSLLPLAGGLLILESLPLAILLSAESVEGWRIHIVAASRLLLYYGPLFYTMILPLCQTTAVKANPPGLGRRPFLQGGGGKVKHFSGHGKNPRKKPVLENRNGGETGPSPLFQKNLTPHP